MLKKFFTGLMAAGMLLATSCQEQEFTPALGEATVTFEVATPEIATRAYSDGMTANKLQYAVYHMNGEQYGTISHKTTDAEIHGTTTLSLQLTAGETYQIILWADAEGAPYTVNFEDKTMIVDYTNVVSNNESLDAFYAVHKFTVTGAQTETVELRRPFAQLNIGTNDYAKAEAASGYVPTQSSVTVKGIYNTLNLADGTVSATADFTGDVTFGLADIDKTEAFPYDDTNYDYVAMNYVLVEGKCLVDVAFTLTDGTTDKTRTVSSVPVQRNYRTNIYGSILTSDVDVNVEIKPGYNTPDNTVEALFQAAAFGGEVTLEGDVELDNPLNVQANMVLNMNGKTLTGSVLVADGVDLTVNEGIIQGENPDYSGIESTGNLTLNDVTVTSSRHGVRIEGGVAVINGGNYGIVEYSGRSQHALNVSDGGKVIINGGTFVGPKGTNADSGSAVNVQANSEVIINGGDFSGGKNNTLANGGTLTVKGGTFDQDPKAYVAAGFKSIIIDNIYHVLPEEVANAAETEGVTSVTESTADVATALATNNGEATMFMWNDVAYIAKYQEVEIVSSADEATTVRGVVESANGLKKATVAEGIEVVGNRTFRKCANLETVELPNTLTEIGPAVFQSCSKLANVTIPASVTTIGEGAFAECTSLTSINIPEGITRLEKDILRNTGLVSIEIPASVNYIGTYAFRDCESLTEVKILSPEFTIENNTFTNMAAPVPTMTIYVVNAEMKAYLDNTLTNYDKSYITVVVM